MLCFRSFLITEASIPVTPDMDAFAKEVVTILGRIPPSQRRLYSFKTLHARDVSADRYGTKFVTVKLKPLGGSDAIAVQPGVIFLDTGAEDEDVRGIINHELIHVFDPKLNWKRLRRVSDDAKHQSWNAATTPDERRASYYNRPQEKDAFRSGQAYTMAREMKDGGKDKYEARLEMEKYIRSMANSQMGKTWQQTDAWDKYRKAFYQALEDVYGAGPSQNRPKPVAPPQSRRYEEED